jgi:hypothetical protein
VAYPLDNALFQWETGKRRLEEISESRERRLADRVVDAIRDELRRRIGPTFRAEQLAQLYASGTEWAADVAAAASPTPPSDSGALTDAAFWLYLRGASDFAGGRQVVLG